MQEHGPPVWEVFWKQQAAFEYMRTQLRSLAIFSFEDAGVRDPSVPQRKFLVTSYDEFWRRYRSVEPAPDLRRKVFAHTCPRTAPLTHREMPENTRHYYELIPQGHPCHLYFDLEFQRAWNPSARDDDLMRLFVQVRAPHALALSHPHRARP